jgi:hypothetical protein
VPALTQGQVTALTAQAALADTYPSTDNIGELLPDWYVNDNGVAVYAGAEVATRGVGVYGQTPDNLVLVGLLKSAALSLIVNPGLTIIVLNTPAAWTGVYNINSLADYLNAPDIQYQSQLALYEGAYQGLIDAGVLTGNEIARYTATFLQPAVRYGVDAVVDWINRSVEPDLGSAILIAARQGQYAMDFVNTYSDELSIAQPAGVSNNTVIRTQIDQAVTDVIDNPKIPDIEYANVEAIAADAITTAAAAANIGNIFVSIPVSTNDDGTFRFAPGSSRG